MKPPKAGTGKRRRAGGAGQAPTGRRGTGPRRAAASAAGAGARGAPRPERRSGAGPAAADRRARQALFCAWRAAEHRKAEAVVALDVRGLAGFTDYFLITHGGNPRQVEAIAEAIEQAVQRGGGPRLAHREGGAEAEWRVLDYLDFVVHIFSAAGRRFYDLERLWQKAPHLALPALRRVKSTS